MATSRSKKGEQLQALTAKFEEAKGIAFIKFYGPTVQEVQNVRRELRANGMSYTVIKKTLISLAAKNTNRADFSSDELDDAVAVICSSEDEIAPAATIKKLKKDFYNKKTKTSKFDFAGAIFNGEFLGEMAASDLADTPTREESIAKIIGMLRSGPRGIHSMLQFGVRGIKNVCENADKFAKS